MSEKAPWLKAGTQTHGFRDRTLVFNCPHPFPCPTTRNPLSHQASKRQHALTSAIWLTSSKTQQYWTSAIQICSCNYEVLSRTHKLRPCCKNSSLLSFHKCCYLWRIYCLHRFYFKSVECWLKVSYCRHVCRLTMYHKKTNNSPLSTKKSKVNIPFSVTAMLLFCTLKLPVLQSNVYIIQLL